MRAKTEGSKGKEGAPSLAARAVRYVGQSGELAMAGVVLVVTGMMLVPLPTAAVDAFIAVNFALSLSLVVAALYVADPTKLAALPSLLLLATLFRLGLTVSTTRLVLLHGDAGRIVEAFGKVVVAGNVIVGGVVFLVLSVVQFIVIAKGAERIAEVSARFTLDALPGKQMAIDADLRAGSLTLERAQERRRSLERESQLYGALDGAMKFVKGDAVAGLVVTAINIVGGFAVGVVQRGMSFSAAIGHYTVLTVGDGLAAQLPALLVSTAAGLVVTRVPGEGGGGLAGDVHRQIFGDARALGITAAVLGAVALAPGIPLLPFATLSAGAAFAAYRKGRSMGGGGRVDRPLAGEAPAESRALVLPNASPIVVVLGADAAKAVEANPGRGFAHAVAEMRLRLFADLGLRVPEVATSARADGVGPLAYEFTLGGSPLARGVLGSAERWIEAPERELAAFGIVALAVGPGFDDRAVTWSDDEGARRAQSAGYRVGTPVDFVCAHLERVLRRHAAEFVGIQETREMADALEGTHPALVAEVLPRLLPLAHVAEVLRRLVDEGVSIRDLRGVFEALAVAALTEKDPLALSECVRAHFRRHLTTAATRGAERLPVYVIAPHVEDALREAARYSPPGQPVAVDPELAVQVVASLREAESAPRSRDAIRPVVVTTQEIRRLVRALVEAELPDVPVYSYQDLVPSLVLQPIGTIGANALAETAARQ